MNLIIGRDNRSKVFLYERELGEQVWEPEPITRFRFKNPIENEWIKHQLAANKPTAGIVFSGKSYIGTNDGMIYNSDKKIQRIPEIFIDPEIFLDEYPYVDNSDREVFEKYKTEGVRVLTSLDKSQLKRILEVHRQHQMVESQQHMLEGYLRGRLGILGFVVSKSSEYYSEETLYDGHLLGITSTTTGKQVNNLAPELLYQINPSLAGFVPFGAPPLEKIRFEVENGLEKRIKTSCVDYRSLWSLDGQGIFVRDICPRDGSGYSPAKFATDGKIIAISHGNHPFYSLDVKKQEYVQVSDIDSIDLNPQKLPSKLIIRNSEVFGHAAGELWNYSRKESLKCPVEGKVTSLSDSGLYTIKKDNKTYVLDLADSSKAEILNGDFVFLEAAPQ